jgi:hypothetical protein
VNIIDATFVDDECLVLIAYSPRSLDLAIELLLKHLVQVFEQSRSEINWKPGKTEALLKYRGKNATKHVQRRRHDGKLLIRIPGSDSSLQIVGKYKHLGGIITLSGSLALDANHKAQAAMTSYAPIAYKVFGSPKFENRLKFRFLQSLILSRLLFNAHIIVPTVAYIRTLNGSYMRVLRRISGYMRYGEPTDADFSIRQNL